jgi:uncharacterized membrane protein
MAFCSTCGTQLAAGGACPSCGSAATAGAATTAAGTGMTDNVAGMLAYVTIIPAIIFLVMAPYNRNRFIRFHSFQCLFVCVAFIAIGIALSILSVIPFLVLLTIPLHFVLGIGGLILWVVLLLKAYQGQMFKLPFIGDMAEKQAAVGVTA